MLKGSSLLIYIAGGDASYANPFDDLGTITGNREDLTGADLVVFTGGQDVSPALYGEEPHPTTSSSWERDMYEKEIYDIALFHRIPMVGICRGLQFLHVMNGGSMIQDIDTDHRYPHHKIVTEAGGLLVTNTLHHQACIYNQKIMERIAISVPDNQVEAAYYPQSRCFGVQFHPEMASCPPEAYAWFQERVKELLGLSTQQEMVRSCLH